MQRPLPSPYRKDYSLVVCVKGGRRAKRLAISFQDKTTHWDARYWCRISGRWHVQFAEKLTKGRVFSRMIYEFLEIVLADCVLLSPEEKRELEKIKDLCEQS